MPVSARSSCDPFGSVRLFYLDFEDRQQMRDRWLRDEFTVVVPVSPSDSDPVDHNDLQKVPVASSMDDEDAIRLLMDHGIAEDKAKIRIQVSRLALASYAGIERDFSPSRKSNRLNLNKRAVAFQRKNS